MAEITIRISDKALRIVGIGMGALCLAWVVAWLWSSGFFYPKYRLRMYVPEVAGMAVRAPVRLDGIDVGAVEAINLAGSAVSPEGRIELVPRIGRRYQDEILTDSTATLITEGLLGTRYVNIHRGFTGRPIPSGGQIRVLPNQEVTFKDFIKALTERLECPPEEKDGAKD